LSHIGSGCFACQKVFLLAFKNLQFHGTAFAFFMASSQSLDAEKMENKKIYKLKK